MVLSYKKFSHSPIGSMVCNIVLSYIGFFIARVIFFAANSSYFIDYMSWPLLWDMLQGALVFDTSAIVYCNLLYIVMVLFPLHFKENAAYYRVTKWTWVVLNAVALAANMADTVYFRFTGRRTTATVFSEFGNEDNLLSIVLEEVAMHWWLLVVFALLVWGMAWLYRTPQPQPLSGKLLRYYATRLAALVVAAPLCIFGIRGGIGSAVRPITISNANQYVNRPVEAAVVLNTPFSIIRTIGKKPFEEPQYMADDEMQRLFDPVHTPADTVTFKPKNVVVMIIESFGKEYIGSLNRDLQGYEGFTPFTDELVSRSLTFGHSYSNGRKSIDGMPSVLSGIPMFIEPFFLTPASLNNVSGLAGELGKKGYETAFFHGAPNGSMGFQAFARATGFKEYYGKTEYEREEGSGDFDGTWAIWDEPFMQYYCRVMGRMREPFMTALFTASSHHPFVIPQEYRDSFPEGKQPIHKCIRYTDHALRRFFESARREPWFANTLFVITADHTNQSDMARYQTDLGLFEVPVIFYAPGDSTLTGLRNDVIAQQIDIMPTVLGYLGYDLPYVAFGCDLLSTPPTETFAVNYNGIYQYVKGNYLMQFDGSKPTAMYRFREDQLLKHNLLTDAPSDTVAIMENELKAIIQQYMQRMNSNRLVP